MTKAGLSHQARRAMSASGAVSGASSDLAGGSSDDNETPRPPPPAVALFEQVCSACAHVRPFMTSRAHCTCYCILCGLAGLAA